MEITKKKIQNSVCPDFYGQIKWVSTVSRESKKVRRSLSTDFEKIINKFRQGKP